MRRCRSWMLAEDGKRVVCGHPLGHSHVHSGTLPNSEPGVIRLYFWRRA